LDNRIALATQVVVFLTAAVGLLKVWNLKARPTDGSEGGVNVQGSNAARPRGPLRELAEVFGFIGLMIAAPLLFMIVMRGFVFFMEYDGPSDPDAPLAGGWTLDTLDLRPDSRAGAHTRWNDHREHLDSERCAILCRGARDP
jgi:hypothetical protein